MLTFFNRLFTRAGQLLDLGPRAGKRWQPRGTERPDCPGPRSL